MKDSLRNYEFRNEHKLKYEGKFKVGDRIRAFDFKPRPERYSDPYMEGVVTGSTIEPRMGNAKVYVIHVDRDSMATDKHTRVGDVGYVPMEIAYDEFDGRVALAP
jgi:hypothetical protein